MRSSKRRVTFFGPRSVHELRLNGNVTFAAIMNDLAILCDLDPTTTKFTFATDENPTGVIKDDDSICHQHYNFFHEQKIRLPNQHDDDIRDIARVPVQQKEECTNFTASLFRKSNFIDYLVVIITVITTFVFFGMSYRENPFVIEYGQLILLVLYGLFYLIIFIHFIRYLAQSPRYQGDRQKIKTILKQSSKYMAFWLGFYIFLIVAGVVVAILWPQFSAWGFMFSTLYAQIILLIIRPSMVISHEASRTTSELMESLLHTDVI